MRLAPELQHLVDSIWKRRCTAFEEGTPILTEEGDRVFIKLVFESEPITNGTAIFQEIIDRIDLQPKIFNESIIIFGQEGEEKEESNETTELIDQILDNSERKKRAYDRVDISSFFVRLAQETLDDLKEQTLGNVTWEELKKRLEDQEPKTNLTFEEALEEAKVRLVFGS